MKQRKELKRLVIDVETASLDATFDLDVALHCIGWKTEDETLSLAGNDATTLKRLQKLIDSGEYRLKFHNASFDVQVLRLHGLDIPKGSYDCTMVMAYCLKPTSSKFNSLDVWGQRLGLVKLDYKQALIDEGYLDKGAKKEDAFNVAFNPVMQKYNIRDLDVTWLLCDYLEEQFELDERVATAYETIELPYVEVVMRLEQNGLFVDIDEMQLLKTDLETRLEPLQKEIAKLGGLVPSQLKYDKMEGVYYVEPKEYPNGKYRRYGKNYYNHCAVEPFNPNSGRQVSWILCKLGWEPNDFSPATGEPCLGAEILEQLVRYPLASKLVEHAKLTKLLNTFVTAIVEGADDGGHIHGRYNQCETKTGRLSSSSPNMQNLPARGSDDAKRVRKCFKAPVGYSLVIGDLSGIEVRILAAILEHWMADSRIADDVRNGVDTHERNRVAWGMESRSPTKNGFFALVYGAWLGRYALTIGKSTKEAKPYFERIRKDYQVIFDGMMPKVWGWGRKKRKYEVYTDEGFKSNVGFVYSLMGSRFHYPGLVSRDQGILSSAKRESFNASIQGTGAGLFKLLTLMGLSNAPVEIFPGAVVHDELLCYIKDEDAEVGAKHLTDVFSSYVLMGVPIQAEFKVCKTWSDK